MPRRLLNLSVLTVFTDFVHLPNSVVFSSRPCGPGIAFSLCSGDGMIAGRRALASQSPKNVFRWRLAETEFGVSPEKALDINAILLQVLILLYLHKPQPAQPAMNSYFKVWKNTGLKFDTPQENSRDPKSNRFGNQKL